MDLSAFKYTRNLREKKLATYYTSTSQWIDV